MGLRNYVGEHVEEGMMVYTFQDGILKSNHLLPNELFKKRSLYMLAYENQMLVMASSSDVHDNDKISCK